MATLKKYSNTTNEQINPNYTVKRNAWSYMQNANANTITQAVGKYSKQVKTVTKNGKKVKEVNYIVPHTVASADFRITTDDIPTNAYINKVTFHVGLYYGNNAASFKVKAPKGSFMIYNGSGKVTPAVKGKTGWYNSTYVVYPSTYIGKNITDVKYTISGTEWNKMKYPTKQIHKPAFGIDLSFQDPLTMGEDSVNVFLRYVYVEIDYELPNFVLTYDKATSANNPRDVNLGATYCLNATLKNTTKANGGNQTIKTRLPFGTSLISSTKPMTLNNDGTYSWVAGGAGNASTTNKICLQSKAFGLREIDSINNNKTYPYFVYPSAFNPDYEEFNIEHGTVQSGEESCFTFSSKLNTSDNTVTYHITLDGNDLTDWSKVSAAFKEHYNVSDGDNVLFRDWDLHPDSALQGVSIVNSTNNSITFDVPEGEDVEIKWTGCFIPLFSGANQIKVQRYHDNETRNYSQNYTSLDPSVKELDFKMEETIWYDHRILTEVDALGYVIPIGVKEFDKVMVEGDCTLKAHIWENIAYIGSIPLKHSHYDPSSDFDNNLLKEQFKNKKYMGKEGVIDEKIDLKIKLPPQDWTTLQGLCDLDKPVPINVVPHAFEGDVLNHRGWIELYGVKGVNKTNPLYYDGKLEVAYLTHNINTRFTIEKGNQTNPYELPQLLVNILDSGEEFANYTSINDEGSIVVNNNGYFTVDTDGAYIYDNDEDIDENLRTLITMDNSQYIQIKSYNVLAEQTQISMTWASTKIAENKENNIERIIYITNKEGKPLFKYQYHDYKFDTDTEYYSCQVTGSRLLSDDSWEIVYEDELLLNVDLESVQLKVDGEDIVTELEEDIIIDDEDEEEDDVYSFNDYTYGSTLSFYLNQNKLIVSDTGYNGKAINFTTELLNDVYLFDLQFQNNNTDGDTEDVVTFFNFEVAESLITSDWSNYYGNMFVSSFPVPHKTILFTRECDEGTIYFLKDDGTPFTYIQDPFYMYFCGVDLENEKGSSIFDFDNSYSIVYLDNGLVRLGFNRLNGDLYLSKWDNLTQTHVNVATLNVTNTDFSVGAFSDDKIEVKAGTTVYTMYRGHPYVVINHPNEDIKFNTTFNSAWAELVNGQSSEFPILWLLANNSNLLPQCVGGRNISKSCFETTEHLNGEVVITPTLTLTQPVDPIYNEEVSIWTLSGTNDILDDGVMILIDGEVSNVIQVLNGVAQTDENDQYITENLVKEEQFGIIFPDNNKHTVRAVYTGTNTKGIAYTDIINVIPNQIDADGENGDNTPTENPPLTGKWKLEIVNLPSTYTYMSAPDWKWKLTKGGTPIKNKLIQKDLPHGGVWTSETDNNGMIYQKLPQLSNPSILAAFRKWTVGKHIVQARFYDYVDDNQITVARVSKTITITKGTPLMSFTGAGTKGKQAVFKLQDPQGYGLPNKKVIISVGGKKYTKTTNSNGYAKLTVNKKGYKTYKVTYAGDKNLKKRTWTFHETVR